MKKQKVSYGKIANYLNIEKKIVHDWFNGNLYPLKLIIDLSGYKTV